MGAVTLSSTSLTSRMSRTVASSKWQAPAG